MHKKITALAATLLAAASIALMPTAPAQADHNWITPPTGAYRMIEANIGSGSECGGPASGPVTVAGTVVEDCVGKLKTLVDDFQPNVIMGNEFCYSDVQPFRDWLEARTTAWTVYYSVSRREVPRVSTYPDVADPTNGRGCYDANGNVESKGEILAGKDLGSYERRELLPLDLTEAQTREHFMPCASIYTGQSTHPTRVCSVHIVNKSDAELEAKNAAAMLSIQNWQEPLTRPLVGGDFNRTDGDAKYLRYLDDSLPTKNVGGASKMTDPHGGDVVHFNARTKSGMDMRQMEVAPAFGFNGVPTSSHPFIKGWVRY